MHEEIIALTRTISGAAETEEALLELLCTAAEEALTKRLREGLSAADCGAAFRCAAAFTAAAGLSGAREDGVSSFTAGAVSVSARGAADTAALAAGLRDWAEQLMAPYVTEGGFAFCGVRG